MTAIVKQSEAGTALVDIAQLIRQAAAHIKTAERDVNRAWDHRKSAGLYLIQARDACRSQKITWTAKLTEHGLSRVQAHLAIAEAGGDAAIEEGGRGRPGGIKAKPPGSRNAEVAANMRAYRARKRERQLLITLSTNPSPTSDTPRAQMLAKITDYFAAQSDQFLATFIAEHLPQSTSKPN